jgi:hypothetical protein
MKEGAWEEIPCGRFQQAGRSDYPHDREDVTALSRLLNFISA